MVPPIRSVQPSPSVIDTSLPNGDVVLVDLTSRRSYSLNPTGAFVWRQIQQGLGEEQIGGAVARRFDVAEAVARVDVRRLLADLLAEGLLCAEPQ